MVKLGGELAEVVRKELDIKDKKVNEFTEETSKLVSNMVLVYDSSMLGMELV